jgi:hypothetical protein
VTEPALRGYYSNLEEPNVSDLGSEALGLFNPLITNLSVPILVQFFLLRVTPYECQIVLQETMEQNTFTSSGSHHTPLTTVSIGAISPPNPPFPVWTTVVSTPSTLDSGLIPSSVVTTASFTQSATGPPFLYGILGFDTNYVLTYSTL